MHWTFEMTIYLILALGYLVCLAFIFSLADKLGAAEFERDLVNYELKKLQAYRDGTKLYCKLDYITQAKRN